MTYHNPVSDQPTGSIIMQPPGWVLAVAFIGTLVFSVLLARRLNERDWYIDPDEQSQMLIIAGTVLAVGCSTLAMIRLTSLPFPGIFVGGFLLGYTLIVVANSSWIGSWVASHVQSPHKRRALAWTLLVPAALFGPWVLSAPGEYVAPGARMVLSLMAIGMIALNAHAEKLDREGAANTSQ